MCIPRERCLQNTIYFLLNGKVKVSSIEHPNTIFEQAQFILQPVGSTVEFQMQEATECILFLFEAPENVCNTRFDIGISNAEMETPGPIVMDICPPLQDFIKGLKAYLNDDMLCSSLMQAKRTELVYLLNCYYPIKLLTQFYAPIYSYNRKFRYFVMQNYLNVKDVEEFAKLGNYSVPTFRRMFKETFGEPAYQWMLKQKKQEILYDLQMSELSISEISLKFGFPSLSNFSHFCRANFGDSPRAIRNKNKQTP